MSYEGLKCGLNPLESDVGLCVTFSGLKNAFSAAFRFQRTDH